MSTLTTFPKLKKKFALTNSYFKNRQYGMPDTILEIAYYFKEHGELPFAYGGENWVYDAMVERQKRNGVHASQFLTPDRTAQRIAAIAMEYGNSMTACDVCAGTGQLTKALMGEGISVSAIEFDYELAELLQLLYPTVTRDRFQDVQLSNIPLVISNPPYEVPELTEFMQWLHVSLDNDGTAILLIPKGFADKERPKAIPEIMNKFFIVHREDMEEDFARTKIKAEIIVLRK